MSFLSGLFKTAVGFIPGVGGGLASLMSHGKNESGGTNVAGMIGDASQVAGNAASAAAAGRRADGSLINNANANLNSQYSTHQNAEMNAGNLDMSRKNFEEGARGGRAKQALLASLLGGGFRPTEINVPGIHNANVTGGLAASLSNPGAQASMAELMKQALAAQMQQGSPEGEQFKGGSVLAPPTMTALPKPGKTESALSAGSLGGSLLASVLANIKKTSGGGD